MQAKDIMTKSVLTVSPNATVQEVAQLLLERRISAAPVVTGEGTLVGIVSEGDLIHRTETGTERHPSWWLRLLASPEESALAYIKSHARRAGDVMTREIVSVDGAASLEAVAETLEKHRIKRVPVVRDGKLMGIVSRADLLRGLVARQSAPEVTKSDEALRTGVEAAISQAGARPEFINVVVSGSVVHLWGLVESGLQKQAARVAAESVAGVKEVRDAIGVMPPSVRAMMWAE